MVKPRGTVKHGGFKPGLIQFGEIEELNIAAWCSDEEAQEPPTQVHLIITIEGLKEIPLVVRFHSPDTLGFIIEQLARYRHEVWPNAEPLEIGLAKSPEIDKLAGFILAHFADEIGAGDPVHGESAVDVAIRLLGRMAGNSYFRP